MYCGVGVIGDIENHTSHPLFYRWVNMINRCYNKSDKSYTNYGAKGVLVSEEWKVFCNYVKDVESFDNYESLIKEPSKWHIDKDISGLNIYSKESCCIITKAENVSIRNVENSKRVLQYSKAGELINKYESFKEAAESIGRHPSGISDCIRGKQKTCAGFIWKWELE